MRISILVSLLWIPVLAPAQMEVQRAYIDRYKEIAVREMERAGVPASIKLAQALLESNSGQSELAQKANNHFGIKCGANWDGKVFHKIDDDFDEFGKPIESCFRGYKRPEESFIAHSEFLRDPKKEWRYGFLFQLDPLDYKSWASGLKKAGYATSATYDTKLIAIIERYQLAQYDNLPVINDPFVNVEEDTYEDLLIGIFQVNDVDLVVAEEGETPASIAARTGHDVFKIIQYNEMLSKPGTPLKAGDRVFLEPKRNNYRGDRKIHYVKKGENMYELSQLYGVKLEKLYAKNLMPPNSQPAEGEAILLRGKKRKGEPRPKLVSEVVDKPVYDKVINIDDFAWPPEEDPFGELIEPEEEEEEEVITTPPTPVRPPEPVEVIEIKPIENPSPEPPPVVNPPVVVEPAPVYHTVQTGDTLYSLSRRYGVTVAEISQMNGVKNNIIKVGQVLRVK